MKNSFFLISLSVFFLSGLSCENLKANTRVTISGNLNGLPDGKMYLVGENNLAIDSVDTKDSRFAFSFSALNGGEPIPVGLIHVDNKKCKRLFNFPTKILYKSKPWFAEYFMLENDIAIYGNLTETTPVGVTLPANIKFVRPDRPIIAGIQTEAMYNVSFDFNQKMNDSVLRKIFLLIDKYPYSYYLLYELKKSMYNFTNAQMLDLIACFSPEVQESPTTKRVIAQLKLRNEKKISLTTVMVNRDNKRRLVIREDAKLNMVILWASWCTPCRKEIKPLKSLYKRFSSNKDFRMVSVSLDENRDNWIEALKKENMRWDQLWITNEQINFQKEIFDFDGSIPTILFLDNRGNLINKFSGFDESFSFDKLATHIENLLSFNRRN